MAPTSMWATRALSVWRRTQTQTRSTSRMFERRGALGECAQQVFSWSPADVFLAAPLAFTHLRHSSTATATSSEADSSSSSSEASEVDADAIPFASLSGKVHPSTLQALTKGPFKYTTMSAVQSRILPLLPGLVAPRTSGTVFPSVLDAFPADRTIFLAQNRPTPPSPRPRPTPPSTSS